VAWASSSPRAWLSSRCIPSGCARRRAWPAASELASVRYIDHPIAIQAHSVEPPGQHPAPDGDRGGRQAPGRREAGEGDQAGRWRQHNRATAGVVSGRRRGRPASGANDHDRDHCDTSGGCTFATPWNPPVPTKQPRRAPRRPAGLWRRTPRGRFARSGEARWSVKWLVMASWAGWCLARAAQAPGPVTRLSTAAMPARPLGSRARPWRSVTTNGAGPAGPIPIRPARAGCVLR
jgi:hypothetical protein